METKSIVVPSRVVAASMNSKSRSKCFFMNSESFGRNSLYVFEYVIDNLEIDR